MGQQYDLEALWELDPAAARARLIGIEQDCAQRGEDFDRKRLEAMREYCKLKPAHRTTPGCLFYMEVEVLTQVANRAYDHPPAESQRIMGMAALSSEVA